MSSTLNVSWAVKLVSGLVAALLLCLLLVVNMPLKYVMGEQLASLNYTDLDGASLLSGDLWLNLEKLPGLTHVIYSWCPGLSVMSWCIDVEHSGLVADGKLRVALDQRISLSGVHIASADLATLGLASGLVEARIKGQLNSLQFYPSNCALKDIEQIDANMQTANIQVFGLDSGAHQLNISTNAEQISAEITGKTFTGNIEMTAGAYRATGEMLAPDTMAAMAQTFMTALGDNRFAWQLSGELPC